MKSLSYCIKLPSLQISIKLLSKLWSSVSEEFAEDCGLHQGWNRKRNGQDRNFRASPPQEKVTNVQKSKVREKKKKRQKSTCRKDLGQGNMPQRFQKYLFFWQMFILKISKMTGSFYGHYHIVTFFVFHWR